MNKNVNEPLLETLHSGYITQGKKVEEFEERLREWFKYPYILTLNSATSGLTLALRMLNLKNTDEILSTPLTCFATNCSILANNLRIKWVDVDPKTCNMDLDDLERKITNNTKAIMVVHWGGSPIDLERLNKIRDKYNIPVIEDCAHSFGAEYNNKKIGTHGNYCVFSLQAIKHLTTGDGGLIFLPNKEEYERAKLLRWYGIDKNVRSHSGKDFRLENDIKEWGYKFHMNDINATIGLNNLPYMNEILKMGENNVKYYKENLVNINGIELLENVNNSRSANWIYTIKVTNKDKFMEFMNNNNIMTSQVHKRNDLHTCVSEFKTELPNLNRLENHIICIPCGWWVTKENSEYIVNKVKEWSMKYCYISKLEEKDKEQFINLAKQFSMNIDFDTYIKSLNDTNIVYVIYCDSKIVATGKLIIETKFHKNMGHIEDIIVDRDYGGLGYGTLIVKYLIKTSKEKNCFKCILDCNERLIKFYENCDMKNEGIQMSIRF